MPRPSVPVRSAPARPLRTSKPPRRGSTRRARATDPALREARIDLAAALRWADRLGLSEGICNHFSYAVPGRDDRWLVNPYGLHWSELRASDVLVVDAQGKVVEGTRPIEPTAFYIHSRIHRGRPSARAVLHCHMPYASALATVEDGRLQPIIQSAMRFHGRIAYDDDPALGPGAGFGGLVLDESEGDKLVRALGDKRVLMMANHGVLVVGETMACALDDLYFLERAAQAQVIAMSTGRRLKPVGDNVAAAVADQMDRDMASFANAHFAAIKRLLDRDAPGWRD
jgi:ribulose-5-phosphate 4-epimerase/fuculose-1-phosphate aldolase